MASGELYRSEIVIRIDDSDLQKLARAEERVNKSLDRMEKRSKNLDRLVASPTAIITDKTAGPLSTIDRRLSKLARTTAVATVRVRDEASKVINQVTNALTRPLTMVVAGAGGAAAVGFPLKFAGEMEQARIAMDFFTESTIKGQQFLREIIDFAAKTPFNFPFLQETAIGLMGAYKGMMNVDESMQQTMRTIRAFGDAAGYTGAGMAGMELSLLGFKQIGMVGVLQMEEMRQVTENLRIPMVMIQKELGLTGDRMRELGKEGIPAARAMEAILSALEKNFGGGMEKLSTSLLGLTSNVKETASFTVMAFGEGMANPVKRILTDIVGSTDYTSNEFQAFLKKMEGAGRRVGEVFENSYYSVKKFFGYFDGMFDSSVENATISSMGDLKKFENSLADTTRRGVADFKLLEYGAVDASTKMGDKFKNLDWGDKLIIVLEKGIDEIGAWLDGEGGQKAEKVFVKLTEIATRAWLTAVVGLTKNAAESMGNGNILGAVGLLLTAKMFGGGLLAKGVQGVFKGGSSVLSKIDKLYSTRTTARIAALEASNPLAASVIQATYGSSKVAPATSAAAVTTKTVSEEMTKTMPQTINPGSKVLYASDGSILRTITPAAAEVSNPLASSIAQATKNAPGPLRTLVAAESPAIKAATNGLSIVSKTLGTVVSKAAMPLAIATEAYDVMKAEDKVSATAKAAGGLGGGWAGAQLGAAIGTAILPGIGTMVGGAIGGIGGYLTGKWATGKIVDTPAAEANDRVAKTGKMVSDQQEKLAATGQVYLDSQGNIVTSNGFVVNSQNDLMQAFTSLAQAVDFASAKLIALSGVEFMPPSITTSSSSVADFRKMEAHATGGILTTPHIGLVAEAGPEAIIPLSSSRRNRALELWQQTGAMLGIQMHAEGGLFGNLRRFFGSDKVQSVGNTAEQTAIGLESTRKGYEKTIHSTYDKYEKRIKKATTIGEAEKARRLAHQSKNLARRFGGTTKVLSRAALPLAIFASTADIISATDKKQAIIKELGSTLGAIGAGALAGAGAGALVGAGVLSPLTAMLGAILGAGAGAYGGQAIAEMLYGRVSKYATGGILTRPHLGLVAEAGPEAIIPLSSQMRRRALELWQKTGEQLGVKPYAWGGFAGPVPALAGGYDMSPVPMHYYSAFAGGQRGSDQPILQISNIRIDIQKNNDIDYESLKYEIGGGIVDEIIKAMDNSA